MKVVCIGSGYVGSVTAAALALLGHSVTVVDVDPDKVEAIRSGTSPVFEPGLSEMIRACAGRSLFAAADYEAVGEADVVFICVGTPSKPDATADLAYVEQAAARIGEKLNPQGYTVIVNKSTVPVGTADMVGAIVEEASGLTRGQAFDVVSNPEFLREGYAVEDVLHPDRIVIGTDSGRAEEAMKELYGPLLAGDAAGQWQAFAPGAANAGKKPAWFRTTARSSEMIKYASNAFLAVKISYVNEIARLCDVLGANVKDVAAGMGMDSRIGPKFLQVSSGWSGSCFPKDTAELLATSQKYGRELQLVKAAVKANERMHRYCVEKLQARLKTMRGKTVGVLGLTFKPNTDDARKSQASVIISELAGLGCRVKAHDPQGVPMFRRLHPDLPVEYCGVPEQAAEKADALLLLTHWDCYLSLDWASVRARMREPYVLDTRNALPAGRMRGWGFAYEGIGI